jgi:hypothetical protein
MATKQLARRKRGSVNKAQAIRDEFATLGRKGRPRDVIAALKAKGIAVSSAQVSNIKASLRKGKGRKTIAASGRSGDGEISLDALLEAKKLADRLGGVEAVKRAVDALARLS